MTILTKKAKDQVPDYQYLTSREKRELVGLTGNRELLTQQYAELQSKHMKIQADHHRRLCKVVDKIGLLRDAAQLRKEQECSHEDAKFWTCGRDDCSYPKNIHSECESCGSRDLIHLGLDDQEIFGKKVMTRNEYRNSGKPKTD